jgi:hypothetical protein
VVALARKELGALGGEQRELHEVNAGVGAVGLHLLDLVKGYEGKRARASEASELRRRGLGGERAKKER